MSWRALSAARLRECWRGLDRVDVVWVLGPHPFSFLVLALAALRRKRIVLGVRQDTPRYYRSRVRNRGWLGALPIVWLMDRSYRVLAAAADDGGRRRARGSLRRQRAGAADARLADRLHEIPDEPPPRDLSGEVELLAVGRIEPEKAPLLLVEAFAELERRRPGRFRLTWAGDGRLERDVRERVAALGLADRVSLLGYVRVGRSWSSSTGAPASSSTSR